MTEQRIEMVALDIAGTSIDEGGAVYVALRKAVESHTGKPIPDDQFDRWKGAGKRDAIIGLLGDSTVDEIDTVERRFTDSLLDAYRSVPPVPLPGIVDAFALLHEQKSRSFYRPGIRVTSPARCSIKLAGASDVISMR